MRFVPLRKFLSFHLREKQFSQCSRFIFKKNRKKYTSGPRYRNVSVLVKLELEHFWCTSIVRKCGIYGFFLFFVFLFFCFSIFIALFSLNNSIHMIYTSCMCIFKLWNSIQTIFNCHKATGVHQKPERKEDQQWMSPWKLKKWNHEAVSTHRHKHTPYRSPWIVNTSCPETGNN